jgi:aminoglycoside phosphotransferase (APT) family kinase protein
MTRPWDAEIVVDPPLARALIAEQFPGLAPARLEPLGAGWDNTAFLVNGTHVFRFPRRKIAATLIETEARILPAIAPRLPLPIPQPTLVGRADARYPWPFAGYSRIPGRPASAAALDESQRADAAEPIARFLAALHAITAPEAQRLGALPDTIGRLDAVKRAGKTRDRLHELVRSGTLEDIRPWLDLLDSIPTRTPLATALVHGDLYADHILLDDHARPSGVIDWGDVHAGDPAIDLSIAHGFLPPAARDRFRRAYGPIDEATWQLARFRALTVAVTILHYAHDIGDPALAREARIALDHVGIP